MRGKQTSDKEVIDESVLNTNPFVTRQKICADQAKSSLGDYKQTYQISFGREIMSSEKEHFRHTRQITKHAMCAV